MSGATAPTSATLISQMNAAFTAYNASGNLLTATVDQLNQMTTLFQAAVTTANALKNTIETDFELRCADGLFAAGIDPTLMASSLSTLSISASSLMDIDDICNRLERVLTLVQMAVFS